MNGFLGNIFSNQYTPLILIAILVIWSINTMMRNFLFTFVAVKMSKGKKVLLFIDTPANKYCVPAKWEGKVLKFQNREKLAKTVSQYEESDFTDFLGVRSLQYDDKAEKVVRKVVNGQQFEETSITPQIADALIVEAKNLPQNGDKFRQLMLMGVLLSCILAGLALYFSWKNGQGISFVSNQLVELKAIFVPTGG